MPAIGTETYFEQVASCKPRPRPTKSFPNEFGVTNASYCTKTDDHFLVDDEHGNEEWKNPKQ